MTNQKLYNPFRVSYNIFISPNFRLPTSNIKQMLLNKRTTSENTRYPTNELNTNNPMNSVEFVSFDNDIQTRGMTDEEIVSSVRSMSKDTESDGEEVIETVSIKNALESLDNVFNFLVHPPAGFNCDASTVSTVRSLRKQVLMHHINNKKQS